MGVKQSKLDIRSRPNKSNALPAARVGPGTSAESAKRWWRLAQATIDDTYPVDRRAAAKSAIADYKRDRAMMASKKGGKR